MKQVSLILGILIFAIGSYAIIQDNTGTPAPLQASQEPTTSVEIITPVPTIAPVVSLPAKPNARLAGANYVDSIRGALAETYQVSINKIYIAINKRDSNHARGIVWLSSPPSGEAEVFLAVKKGDLWHIDQTGSGAADCELLRMDGFSQEMIGEICK